MEPWFGPLPGSNEGYHGLGMRFGVMPASWEGWLVTLIYAALQVFAVILTVDAVAAFGAVGAIGGVAVVLLHIAYLGFAAGHLPPGSDAQSSQG